MVNFTCLLCSVLSTLGSVAWMCIQCAPSIDCLSALVSWARLCVSIMLDACLTTDSYIRAVICRCTAYIYIFFFSFLFFLFDYVFISIA